MSLHASPLATRHATLHGSAVRRTVVHLLQSLSKRLEALAERLQTPPAAVTAPAVSTPSTLEYRHDPATGHGVLYEDGQRRFTFLQGLERL